MLLGLAPCFSVSIGLGENEILSVVVEAPASSPTVFRPPSSHSSLFKDWGWTLPSILYLLILYVLPSPAPLSEGGDQSYQAMLTELFLRGAQFGKDIIFTFGPWGFLLQPRGDPRIFPWVAFGHAVLALGTLVGAASLAGLCLQNRWAQGAWLLAFVVIADPVLLLPFLMFAVVMQDRENGASEWGLRYAALLPACGLAACVKFTALILVASLMFFFVLDGLFRSKRSVWIAVGLLASFIAFFLAPKQHLSNLPDYLVGSLSVTSSFSTAMGLPGSLGELAWGLLLCAIVPVSYVVHLARSKKWRLLPLSAWLFAYFFLGFKQALVRSDPFHLYSGMVYMILPACLGILIQMLGSNPAVDELDRTPIALRPRLEFWMALLITAGGGVIALLNLEASYASTGLGERLRRLPLAFSAQKRQETYQREVERLRVDYPLSPLQGTVGFMGYQLFILPVWGLDPRPAPALQTYAAYNAYLSAKDADFFAGPQGPEHVLLGIEPLDQHFPTVEDSLAWLALRAHYVPDGFSGKYLHLRRTQHAVAIQKEKLAEKRIRFGEKMALPEAAPLWAEVEIHPNALGRLAGMLLKAPAIRMAVDSSKVGDYRILPENASAGFLLSPIIDTPAGFELLYRSEYAKDSLVRAVSFRVSPAAGERMEVPEIVVRIYRLIVSGGRDAGG